MVFQHQYQYQYQYQTEWGFQYQSFAQLVREIPLEVVFLSVMAALLPFLVCYLWKRPSFVGVLSSIYRSSSYFAKRLEKMEAKRRIEEDYITIKGKGIEFASVVASTSYLAIAGLLILVAKKMIFFGLVVSQSMLPVLMPADLVLCEAISLGSIEVGDIIVFIPPGGSTQTIHRVVSIDGGIKTKGDNVGTVDPWTLTMEDVQGKAVLINGKPVVVKNLGMYFMPRRVYVPGSDPTYEFIRDLVATVHRAGPIFVLAIFALILLLSLGGKGSRYPTPM
jgi:signal peptidase I